MRWIELSRRWLVAACVLALAAAPACRDDSVGGHDDESGTDGSEVDGGSSDGTDEEVEYLDPVDHLVRASMALRGMRPSIADIEAVEGEPDALREIVDKYLESPQFGEVIRDLHDDALHVAAETILPVLPPLDMYLATTLNESAMRTPLRLAQHIVENDLPYTELVTADYVVIDQIAADVWGWPYDSDGETWQVVPMEGRPAAGILADSALFVRFESAGANYNRGRANAISSALLCLDFQSLDIDVASIDLSDPDAVNNAVVELPQCSGCHHTLDPLASNLFGHFPTLPNADQLGSYPLPQALAYQTSTEGQWAQSNEREPGYFGANTEGLGELGQLIAGDPQFAQCAATRFYAYFTQTRREAVPAGVVGELQEVFTDSGFNAKALVREIVLSDDFRAARGLNEETAGTVVGVKKARPYQLGLLMEDLTGFRWELDGSLLGDAAAIGTVDLTRNATIGFRLLGGAGDSLTALTAADTVNATTSLFVRQFANEAASYVVERDFASDEPDERALLGLIEPDQSDEDAVRAQLAWLFLRLYAQRVEPGGTEVDAIYPVFAKVMEATDDAQRAWKATLAAMLQDFSILYY